MLRDGARQTWAMLIRRVYEIDPLTCSQCGGQMKAFIEPPQGDVIEKILRGHRRAAMVGGLWCASSPRAPPANGDPLDDPDRDWGSHPGDHESGELTFVDEATFWATF